MKNWIMIAVAAFSVSFSQGFGYGGTKTNEPERVAPISAKAILQNSNGYFVLADGTLWKAIGFSKRWRTLTEWWNNVQLVPENYECVPNDWFLGTAPPPWTYWKRAEAKALSSRSAAAPARECRVRISRPCCRPWRNSTPGG